MMLIPGHVGFWRVIKRPVIGCGQSPDNSAIQYVRPCVQFVVTFCNEILNSNVVA